MMRIGTVVVLLALPAVLILLMGRPLVAEDPAHRPATYWRRQGLVFLVVLAAIVGVAALLTATLGTYRT